LEIVVPRTILTQNFSFKTRGEQENQKTEDYRRADLGTRGTGGGDG